MGISVKLKWKRTINRLRFLFEEYEFVKDMSREGSAEFEEYYAAYCAQNEIDLQKLNKEHAEKIAAAYGPLPEVLSQLSASAECEDLVLYEGTEEEESEYQLTRDELEIHESFNKVFKKLALIYHPDKVHKSLTPKEKLDMLNAFKEISGAFEKRRYFVLLDYAEKNNITVPKNYKQQTRWMKQEVTKLEGKIHHEKKTYNYLFAESETDEKRDQIIRQFLKQLFDLKT